MNDLVAVDKDKFYITALCRFRTKAYVVIESYMRMRNGRIIYYDGHKGRVVADGFFMPNGISMSPDKSMIYMAEFGYKTIHAFRRDDTNNLVKAWENYVDSSVDNIDVDPETGDLWIGSHPVLWKIMDFYNWFGSTPPSQVLRVKIRDNIVSDVEEIYSDNGEEIAGSTVAVHVKGDTRKIIIGSVSAQTIVCDVTHLSP